MTEYIKEGDAEWQVDFTHFYGNGYYAWDGRFGFATKNILSVVSYHILWGALAIAAFLAANQFFNASLNKYTLEHLEKHVNYTLKYVKNMFITFRQQRTV